MIQLIDQLQSGGELSTEQVASCADFLLDAKTGDTDKARLLKALATKGETPAEIAAFVEAFLLHAVDPGFTAAECSGPAIDVCGTGGDKLDLFNISTTSVFVILVIVSPSDTTSPGLKLWGLEPRLEPLMMITALARSPR